MNIIDNLISSVSLELIHNRRYNYSEDSLDQYLKNNKQIVCNQAFIKNKRGQSLNLMILKHGDSSKNTYMDRRLFQRNLIHQVNVQNNVDTCLIYAHGLGSNKLEGIKLAANILQKHSFHICLFDFSGSGKSQGQYTTYGIREQDDINAILTWLDSKRMYKKYVLWGRSMGGTAIVLSQARNFHPKIQCIILDSPFSSFEKVAIQMANRNSVLPEKMLEYIIEPLKRHMEKKYPKMNPFSINLKKQASKIHSRIMLIYSKDDKIVNYSHSKQISKECRKSPFQIQIEEDHNKPRKASTYQKAIEFIIKSLAMNQSRARRSNSKKKGITVQSKQISVPKQRYNNNNNKQNIFTPRLSKKIQDKTLNFDKTAIVGINSIMTQSYSDYQKKDSTQYSGKNNMIKSVFYEKTPIENLRNKRGGLNQIKFISKGIPLQKFTDNNYL